MDSHDLPLAGLGYVGVAAPDPVAWRDFATDVCGLMPALTPPGPREAGAPVRAPEAGGIAPDGTAYLKMDDRQWRLAVHPSDEPGLRYLGFEVPTLAGLDASLESLALLGVETRPGSDE
jgi:3,4-dihydroxy-9,10-secoandrosta-1,3,5(10)-triene-9,17-dione 4,5-dioxygenase